MTATKQPNGHLGLLALSIHLGGHVNPRRGFGHVLRFRQEERLRADLRRERRLRQQAISERVEAMKANIAKDLATQHELTLDALENELRTTMEAELETMEREVLAAEEARPSGTRLAT